MLHFDEPELLGLGGAMWGFCALVLLRGCLGARRDRWKLAQRTDEVLHRRLPALAVLVRLFAAGALVIAAAGPRLTGGAAPEPVRRGRIAILLDVSESMWAEDVSPSRLEAARNAVIELVRLLPEDRVGLVAFGGGAFVACPLTRDHNALLATLSRVSPDLFVGGGTAVAAGLSAARELLGRGGGTIVLVSDGEFHGAELDRVLERLKESGAQVHAVGVGTREGIVLEVPAAGGREVKRTAAGEPVRTRYDPDTLTRVISAGEGRLWHYPREMPERRGQIVRETFLDRAEKGPRGASVAAWPVLIAAILLIGSYLVRLTGR